jgi:hypothetical protein
MVDIAVLLYCCIVAIVAIAIHYTAIKTIQQYNNINNTTN